MADVDTQAFLDALSDFDDRLTDVQDRLIALATAQAAATPVHKRNNYIFNAVTGIVATPTHAIFVPTGRVLVVSLSAFCTVDLAA